MKKKFLLPLLGLLAIPAWAANGDTFTATIYDWEFTVVDEDAKTCELSNQSQKYYTNYLFDGENEIPETVTNSETNTTYTVVGIGEYAFEGGAYKMDSGEAAIVILPETIEYIGQYAFESCNGMTEINIPASCTNIDYAAFMSCTGLTDIYVYAFPTSVKSYYNEGEVSLSYNYVFYQVTTSDITLHVGENVVSGFAGWGGYTWKEVVAIEGYNAPVPDLEVGDIFYYDGICYEVKDIDAMTCITASNSSAAGTWPQGSYIGRDIEIPETVNYYGTQYTVVGVGYDSFNYCDTNNGGVKWSISLPATTEFIDDYAFYGCYYLQSITIDATSLTSIGSYAFAIPSATSETSLESIEFTGTPADGIELTLESSTGRQFMNLVKLEKLVLPVSLQNLPVRALDMTSSSGSPALTELIIPRNVKTIGQYAIRYCNNLETLSIPAGVTSFNTGYGVSGVRDLANLYQFATEPGDNIKGIRYGGNYSTPSDITLYVPREGISAYQAVQLVDGNDSAVDGFKTVEEITYEEGDLTYVVLNDTDAELNTTQAAVEMIIPATVEIYTNILNVTQIAASAIVGQNLLSLTVESVTPPTATGAFTNLNPNAVLYVPEEAVAAYQVADVWKDFYRIRPIGYEAPSVDEAFELSPANNTDVTELETITVSSTVFTNLKGVGTTVNVNDAAANVTSATNAEGELVITLASPVTTLGAYTVELPAGFFTYTDDIYTVESPALTLSVNVVAKTVNVTFTFTTDADPKFVTGVALDNEPVTDWAEGFEAAEGQSLVLTLDMTYEVTAVTLNGESIVDDIVTVDNVGTYTVTVGSEDLTFNFDATSAVNTLNAAALENAEFYNLNGVRVNRSNLTPGIYVVRQGDKTSKVVVK